MSLLRRSLVVLAAVVLAGAPASVRAHTDIDYTLPTDGAAVGEVVTEITVAFMEPVTLIGPGFEVLDPQGRVLTPFVVTDDDVAFRLQLDPPLGGGLVAVKYTVAAQDGHTIDGNFTFTVAADEPVVTEPPATTTVPPSDPDDEAPTSEPPAPSTVGDSPDSPSPSTAAPPTTTVAPDTPATAPAEPAEAAEPAEPVAEDVDDAAGAAAGDDDGSTTTLVLLGLGAVVAAAFALLLMRSRSGP